MKTKINNIVELRLEIARLNQLKREQEGYLADQYQLLKYKIDTPVRVLNAITSNIPGVEFVKGIVSSLGPSSKSGAANQHDWLGRALQLGLPLVLNKTFLRKSGWLKKALVLLLSNKAAGNITQDKVESVISKITNFIRPKKKSKKKHREVAPLTEIEEQEAFNFGIPPDSETY